MTQNQTSLEAIRETDGREPDDPLVDAVEGLETEERKTAAESLNAAYARFRGSKKLLDETHPRWKALVNVRTRLRNYWDFATLPYCLTGVRMLLRSKKEEIFAMIGTFQAELITASIALDEVRDELLAEARAELGSMFRSDYYPASFSGKFTLEARERSIEPPPYLMHTNAEEYKRELARSLSDIQTELRKFETDCWNGLGTLAGKLHLAMTGRLTESSIANFQSLFDRVAYMNFEGSEVFNEALGRAEEILDGLDADDLRASKGLRGKVKADVEALVEDFGQLRSKIELANPVPVPVEEPEAVLA